MDGRPRFRVKFIIHKKLGCRRILIKDVLMNLTGAMWLILIRAKEGTSGSATYQYYKPNDQHGVFSLKCFE